MINLKITRGPLLSIISCLLTMGAQSATVTINNPSFESQTIANGTFNGGQASGPTNWAVYNSGATNNMRYFGVWNPTGTTTFMNGAPDGVNVGVVYLENLSNLAEAGLQQTLGATLQLSTEYKLMVDVGNFTNATFDSDGFPGYRVEILAGSTLIASDNNTLSPTEGFFETSTVSFTTGSSHANAGEALTIRLVNLNGPGTEVNFDDVRLDATPTPEPSALALGAMSMVCVMFKRRRF